MTWRRVAQIYLVLAVLAAFFVSFERESRQPAPDAVPAGPERSLLGTDAAAIEAVVFRRESALVRAQREGDRWRVVEPAGAPVQSDLVAAALATLTAGQVSEGMVDAAGEELQTFGLAKPLAEIEVTLAGNPARTRRVFLGADNPTRTAIYARRDDRTTVFLVGRNLRYYVDLIFQAAAGRSAMRP